MIKQRNIALCIVFSIITFGIYALYWFYKMGEKIDAIKTKNGQPAGNSSILFLLLQLCGLGIVSYAIMQDTINKNA